MTLINKSFKDDHSEEERRDLARFWELVNVFEKIPHGADTKYRDAYVTIVNNWKVVALDVVKYTSAGFQTDRDLFAVLTRETPGTP